MKIKIITSLLLCSALFVAGCRSSTSDSNASSSVDSQEVVGDVESSLSAVEIVTATPDSTLASAANSRVDSADGAEGAADSEASAESSAPGNTSTTGSSTGDDSQTAQVAQSEPVAASVDTLGVMPERIHIPSINLDTPVVELAWHPVQDDDGRIFSEWDVADQAAGWHKNSSLLSVGGNVVLSGHNNILGAVFRELDQLKRGDEAVLWAEGEEHRYLIDKVMIVPEKYATQEQREANAGWIGHFDDDRLTLVSCWPRDDNSHRIIVVAYSEESQVSLSD